MRYLAVANSVFKDSPSGSARVAWDIARLARAQGHHVTFLCSSPSVAPDASSRSFEDGITVIRFGRPRVAVPALQGRRAYRRGLSAAVTEHARNLNPDVVHLHSLLPADAAIACLGDQNYVATVYSPVVPEQRANWAAQGLSGRAKILLGGLRHLQAMQEAVLTRCRRLHILSSFAQAQLARYHESLPEWQVIPHWLSRPQPQPARAEARRALGWDADDMMLFSLRRLVPRMGHLLAIEAIGPVLERNNARLVFAGDGPLRSRLSALGASIDAERIQFVGRVSDEQAAMMYAAADLFVQPTVSLECFGLTLLESLASGIPVLATACGAIPEILGRILPDFLVAEGSRSDLRAKAEAFMSGELRPPPAPTLQRFVEDFYGEPVVAPRLAAFLFK